MLPQHTAGIVLENVVLYKIIYWWKIYFGYNSLCFILVITTDVIVVIWCYYVKDVMLVLYYNWTSNYLNLLYIFIIYYKVVTDVIVTLRDVKPNVKYWPDGMPMNLVMVLVVKEPYWVPGCHHVDVVGYVY